VCVCPIGACARSHYRHHHVVAYSSDLTDAQRCELEPLLLDSSKRAEFDLQRRLSSLPWRRG